MKYLKTNAMDLKNHFELSRFRLLLRMELTRSRKGILMTLLITLGVLFIMGLLLGPLMDPAMVVFDQSPGFAFTLLTGGFILSSLAYRDLGNSLRIYNYLTLPVSALEKLLSMWLLTSAGWILFYTIVYSLYALLANAVGQLVYDHLTFLSFNPLGPFALKTMAYYFVLQGIFLAGAAHFRGYAFPKTLLALVIMGAAAGIIMYLVMRGLFDFDMSSDPDLFAGMLSEQVWNIVKLMFWCLLAPLCWVITYLGLKEQEVKHGI
jgi:hypothetical protein